MLGRQGVTCCVNQTNKSIKVGHGGLLRTPSRMKAATSCSDTSNCSSMNLRHVERSVLISASSYSCSVYLGHTKKQWARL